MRSARRLIASVVVLAALTAAARGQEPPPAKAKHENKITPGASEAIEKFTKLVYCADRAGLETCSGALVPIGFTSRERSSFRWDPPDGSKVRVADAISAEMKAAGMWQWTVRGAVYMALHPDGLLDYAEFDARIAQRKDRITTLAMTEYEDGKELSSDEFVLNADGLVTTRIHHAAKESSSQAFTATYSYAKVGDAYCVAAMEFVTDEPTPARYAVTLRYADVADVHLPVSYDIDVTPKAGAPRKITFHVADLVVNGKPVVLSAPWKHVNRVSPEAQVAMERYARLVYRPTDHGLQTISGTMAAPGTPSSSRRRFEFRAGGHVRVEENERPNATPQFRAGNRLALSIALEATLVGLPLVEGDEYDAEFRDIEGVRTLVVTRFLDGVKDRADTFVFEDSGLVRAFGVGGGDTGSPLRLRIDLAWQPLGDRFRIETIALAMEVTQTSEATRVGYELTYAELRGIQLVTSYSTTFSGVLDGKVVSEHGNISLSDVVVNGVKVDSPSPAIHEARISPEARTAIERYLQRRYVPAVHGLRSLSGQIVATWTDEPRPPRFTYSPADHVVVKLPEDVDPGAPAGQQILASYEFPLILALDGMEVAGGPEFDAGFVERGGVRLLEIAGYEKGRRTETRELDFDGNGLIASSTLKYGEDPATSVIAAQFRFTWQKTGDLFRIVRADILRKDETGAATRTVVALTYSRLDGVDVPTAFTFTRTEKGETKTYAYALRDLVVNGKKVETPAPPVPADGENAQPPK